MTVVRYSRLTLWLFSILSMFVREGLAHAEPSWPGLSRAYVKLRPFAIIGDANNNDASPTFGGVIMDLGVEANTRSGFRIGMELAPITVTSIRAHLPLVSSRIHLGYANQFVGISLAVGGGLSWIYPQLGLIARAGRFDRAHALLRILWSIYPPIPEPVDFDLEVNIPLRGRLWLHANVGGGYGNLIELIGIYASAGARVMLAGNGESASRMLTVGLGAVWLHEQFGPSGSLGYEQRF